MQEDMKYIHEASMKILEEIGVRFYHSEILNLLKQNGIKVSNQTAYFTEGQIMKWISKAPSSFQVYARNPKYNMLIGGEHTEYGPCYGAPTIIDMDGTKRPALYKDYLNLLKLVHQSEFFNINGGLLCQPSDLKGMESYPILLYSTIIHSDKCLMGGPGGLEETNIVMDMLGIVFGGKDSLVKHPRIITILSGTSPLQFDKETLDTMLVYCKHGQPVIITPAPMAGTTGPVTLAGTISMGNAETLAAIAVTQMIKENTPVIYGLQAAQVDMKTACISIGAPETAICQRYAASLAKFYALPCRGSGTINDAKSVSVQSGYESMMGIMVSCQEKMNIIIHSAGVLDSHGALSYEQFIVDLEIIGMVKRFLNGLKIDTDTLALEIIRQVGPGGEFITSDHTLKYFRKEQFVPDISIRGILHGDNPNDRIIANIKIKKEKMLTDYIKPELPININSQLVNYLAARGIDLDSLC